MTVAGDLAAYVCYRCEVGWHNYDRCHPRCWLCGAVGELRWRKSRPEVIGYRDTLLAAARGA